MLEANALSVCLSSLQELALEESSANAILIGRHHETDYKECFQDGIDFHKHSRAS